MGTALQFRTAKKEKLKARIALIGLAGGGKTFTALRVMRGLVGPKGRIALIDTERESALLYADQFQFDHLALTNHHPQQYIDALTMAAQAGYDGVIIDSLSHAWMGKDGALELVDKAAKRSQSGNSFMAWRDVTPLHNALVDAMLGSPFHLIVTVRAKSEYVIEEGKNGKSAPRKVGLAPIQRDGLEFEFTLVGDMTMDNELLVGKTRWADVRGQVIDKPGEALGVQMAKWLNDGAERAADDEPAPPAPTKRAPTNGTVPLSLEDALLVEVRGKPLGNQRSTGLREVGQWAQTQMDEEGESERLVRIKTACHLILEAREAGAIQEPAKKERAVAKAAATTSTAPDDIEKWNDTEDNDDAGDGLPF